MHFRHTILHHLVLARLQLTVAISDREHKFDLASKQLIALIKLCLSRIELIRVGGLQLLLKANIDVLCANLVGCRRLDPAERAARPLIRSLLEACATEAMAARQPHWFYHQVKADAAVAI